MLDLFGNETPTPEEATGYKGAGANRAHSTSGESTPNQRTAVAKAPREPLPRITKTRRAMDEIEQTIVRKMQSHVTFVPGSSHKRFILYLNPATSKLSDGGRNYLAYIANRYRRQWKCTHEEFCWIVQWCRYGAIPEVRQDGVL